MNYYKRNFKSIGDLIEPLVKRHGQLNIISYAKLLDIWDTIVGKEISETNHGDTIQKSLDDFRK